MNSLIYFQRIEAQGYCPHCAHVRSIRRRVTDHRVHLVLTIATCGLWSVAWFAIWWVERKQPWRCRMCRRVLPSKDHALAVPEPAERTDKSADDTVASVFRPAPRTQRRFRRAGIAE